MPTYDIYALGDSDIQISNGASLDGVTQGDGSHLVGETITITAPSWQPVTIRDDNTQFDDNDTTQRLDGAQTFDGVGYADNTIVESEYTLTVTHNGETYTLVGFNLNNSSPAYGTVEGLAVIGDAGGFPPPGVPLTVTSASEGPSGAQSSSYARPICFASGTMIDTEKGPRPVERLCRGDRVMTLDDGAQPLRWVAARRFPAAGRLAPVRFAPGVLGNALPLIVSPQHRILVQNGRTELLFGTDRVLVPALHFVNGGDVTRVTGGTVRYHHILFDRHQIVLGDGVASESYHPAQSALSALDARARAELLHLFPELQRPEGGPLRELAAPSLRRHEAAALLAA